MSAQAAASQEMQQQLAQQMQALLQQELAKHQQSMANKVQRIAERERGRPKRVPLASALPDASRVASGLYQMPRECC